MSDVFSLEFLKWKKSAYDLFYRSGYSISECIRRIMEQPWTYSDPRFLGEMWYCCEQIAEDTLHITFSGGQFRKMVKTEYCMKFITESCGSVVLLTFEKELTEGFFGGRFHIQVPPMTLLQDMDQFMKEKLSAERIPG